MNKKSKIAAVICTYNNEDVISRCLDSVKWADEIVVVDDGSTDKTVEIVKKFTDKIYHHKSVGYVEPVRNFAISKATGDWILILDADEEVSGSLVRKLQEISENSDADVIAIPRRNIIFGKWIEHTGWWPDRQIRFFRKGMITWSDKIHSSPEIKGKIIKLDAEIEDSITHHNYSSISSYLRRMDKYTTVEAKEFINAKKTFDWTDVITKPFGEFMSRFFAREGFKDGLHGLVLSFLQSVSVLVVYLKIWESGGFKEVEGREFSDKIHATGSRLSADLRYWFIDWKIHGTKNSFSKILYKIQRKIK